MTTYIFPTIECEKFDYEKYYNEQTEILLQNKIKYYDEKNTKYDKILRKIKNLKNIDTILKYHKILICSNIIFELLMKERYIFKLKIFPYHDNDTAICILNHRISIIESINIL